MCVLHKPSVHTLRRIDAVGQLLWAYRDRGLNITASGSAWGEIFKSEPAGLEFLIQVAYDIIIRPPNPQCCALVNTAEEESATTLWMQFEIAIFTYIIMENELCSVHLIGTPHLSMELKPKHVLKNDNSYVNV